jgi:transcription antitermination factor NusG
MPNTNTTVNTSIEAPHAAVQIVEAEAWTGGEQEADLRAAWYAAYTRANHEKRVADQLAERGVAHFLPQYDSVRKWKDRKVHLQMPLFPGYVFVHLALRNRLKVLQVPGIASLVGCAGRPVAVPEEEFARIRGFLKRGLRAEPHPYLTAGRRVRVCSGPRDAGNCGPAEKP